MTNHDPSAGSCERSLLLLSLAIDGAATPSQEAELRAHLPGCASCRRAASVDAAVRARLLERADAPVPAWSEGFAARTARLAIAQLREARAQNRLLWMSAAAALLVAVSAQVVLRSHAAEGAGGSDIASIRESTRLALIRPPRLNLSNEGK